MRYTSSLLLCLGIFGSAFAAAPPPRQLFLQYENTVWWGTDFGLNRYQTENELWANIRPETVTDLCTDEKNLWVGTEQGVFYADLRYLDWKSYTAKQGLPSDTIVRIAADLDYIYSATPHGLARFNKLVEQWEPMGDFSGKRIYDLYSNQTTLWVATDAGIFYFDKKFEKWLSYTASTGLISNVVYRVFYFSDYIWVLTDKGFSRYSESMKSWNSYKLGDGILGPEVNFMLQDASFLWIVSTTGVARFNAKNQSWENFSKNMPIEKATIYSISTSGTTSWFTTSNGVYSFDEDQRRWKTYTSVDGLSDDVQEQIFTTGSTTLCRKGTTFSYLKPTDDLWYPTQVKVTGGGKMKQSWKAHCDETGLGVATPGGQSLNLLGRAYVSAKNKAEFPEPLDKSIGNYIMNKNLDSISLDTAKTEDGRDSVSIVKTPRYKDYLNGWAKAQMNLNADLGNGRTFRASYDNTDPLGDLRYGAEYRGFGDDFLRRLGWRTDQKTDYFYSTQIDPTYLEGAGIRTEFGDRVGDKKLRRVNTGLWAGWRKTKYLDTLIQFNESNFYDLGIRNIMTESVIIKVDGTVIDPNLYSIERTMGLLTFKNESVANPDSRIEITCEYQPQIGEFTNEMASAENVVVVNDKVALGVTGAYIGTKQPDRTGLGLDTNRAFVGSVNSKVEMKSDDGKLYLRAIPEVSGSYNDSVFYDKQGTGAKLGLYSTVHNLKLKGSATYQSPNFVSLADQSSIYGRLNNQAEGEAVYDIWQQYMPVTVGGSFTNGARGNENREYIQYLLSPPEIPSIRLYVMHQGMKNLTKTSRDSVADDSIRTERYSATVESEWGRSFANFDRVWYNASYSVNLITDSLDSVSHVASTGQNSLSTSYNQHLNHNIFAWVRLSPVKKLQLEIKNVQRYNYDHDTASAPFKYRGLLWRPEIKLFSQEWIPGITLYGKYSFSWSQTQLDSAFDFGVDTVANSNGYTQQLNSSILIIPGEYTSILNPFQLNLGYNFSKTDSTYNLRIANPSGVGASSDSTNLVFRNFNHSFSFKPMLDFSEDLHFASRTELSEATQMDLATRNDLLVQSGVKVYNEARLAFRERKTRFDVDYNIFSITNYLRDTSVFSAAKTDTTVYSLSHEVRFKWTERWQPNFRTELPIGLTMAKVDSTYGTLSNTTGFLSTITPGILFDARAQGKSIREFRVQFYVGAALAQMRDSTGHLYLNTAEENKLDVQVKVLSNFFIRMLLNVSYLINDKKVKYDLAEIKATALF